MSKRVNPRNVPKTQADVDAAEMKGTLRGLKGAEILMLNVLLDKHSHEIDVTTVWSEFQKIEQEFAEGRINLKELSDVLIAEHDINLWDEVKWGNVKWKLGKGVSR